MFYSIIHVIMHLVPPKSQLYVFLNLSSWNKIWYISWFESGYNSIMIRDAIEADIFKFRKINTENLQNKKFSEGKKAHSMWGCAFFVSVILLRKRAEWKIRPQRWEQAHVLLSISLLPISQADMK